MVSSFDGAILSPGHAEPSSQAPDPHHALTDLPTEILFSDRNGWYELSSKPTQFAHRSVANPYEISPMVVRREYRRKAASTCGMLPTHVPPPGEIISTASLTGMAPGCFGISPSSTGRHQATTRPRLSPQSFILNYLGLVQPMTRPPTSLKS